MFVCFEFIISYNGRGKEKCLQRRNAGSQILYLKNEKKRPNIFRKSGDEGRREDGAELGIEQGHLRPAIFFASHTSRAPPL